MTFGAKLKALRQEHELTQYQLAKKLDTSKSNISKYESDSIEPSMRTLVLIAKYFNVSIDYLLGNSQYSKTIQVSTVSERELLNYFHKIQNTSLIPDNEKKLVKKFFPFAVVLQTEEQELLQYYNELNIKDRRWIMGQIIDLIKKADENASDIPKAQGS